MPLDKRCLQSGGGGKRFRFITSGTFHIACLNNRLQMSFASSGILNNVLGCLPFVDRSRYEPFPSDKCHEASVSSQGPRLGRCSMLKSNQLKWS